MRVLVLPILLFVMLVVGGCDTHFDSYSLCALSFQNDTRGDFFLATGTIDSVPRYYAMVNTNKGMALYTVSARKAYIVETTVQSPMMVLEKTFDGIVITTTFYIPPGSLYRGYDIDIGRHGQ